MTFDESGQGALALPLSQPPCSTKGEFREDPSAASEPIAARVVSLFAGIGGFDRAFELAGGEVVMQCEYNRYCRSVLRRHWPNVTLAKDIRTLAPEDIPDADVWTAGFPCQDVSLARGNHGRSGFKGNHTSLFFKLMDLIKARRPPLVLLENVVGLLNSHKGRDFAIVLQELTEAGYAVSWRVLNARYFGVPQSRSRVFLCAWLGDYRRALTALFEPVPNSKLPSESAAFKAQTTHPSGAVVPEIAYCVAATSGRHTGNDWSRSYVSYADRVRRPTPTESERLQGFPAGWSLPEDGFRRPARGFDGDRYRSVGNAVAVPVVRWIADRIVGPCRGSALTRPHQAFESEVGRLAPQLRTSAPGISLKIMMGGVTSGSFERRWKTGGCAWGDTVVEAMTSPAPSKPISSQFKDVLDDAVPDDRYFLTANAALGMLRRADSVGRTLFAPMRHALAELVAKVPGAVAADVGEGLARASVCPPGTIKRKTVAEPGPERARAY